MKITIKTIITVCIVLIFIFSLTYLKVQNLSEQLNYCHNNGYTGVHGTSILSNKYFKCYKEVIHESGNGIDFEYSGNINKELLQRGGE